MDLARSFDGALTQPHWFMAREQTGARGRQGRDWKSPVGSLSTTVVFNPNCAPAAAANYSFVMALAVADTLAEFVDPSMIGQKWPNDVLVQGRKCAGILLETASATATISRLMIGVGINLTGVPDGIETSITDPIGIGDLVATPPTADDVLAQLITNFQSRATLYQTNGFAAIRADWLTKALKLGQTITARLPKQDVIGVFDTIDATGNLVLETRQGPRVISAADVYF